MKRTKLLPIVVMAALLILLAAGLPTAAYAADITVNSPEDIVNDDGDCTLREAIENANNNNTGMGDCAAGSASEVDTIFFADALGTRTITLDTSLGQLTISEDLDIRASERVTVNGAGIIRVFTTTVDIDVEISNLAVVNGEPGIDNAGRMTLIDSLVMDNDASGINNTGVLTLTNTIVESNEPSGIFNEGELLVVDSIIRDNRGSSAAGIANAGTATVRGSVIEENYASGLDGGGIYNSGTMLLDDATISNNGADIRGGGILNAGSLTVTDSTISENYTNGNDGAGIYVEEGGDATIRNTSVILNASRFTSTSDSGGGIYVEFDASFAATDSAISQNSAGSGGGIYNAGSLILEDSVLAGNVAFDSGAGIHNDADIFTATVSLTNTDIISNSASGAGGGIYSFATGDPCSGFSGTASVRVTGGSILRNEAGSDGGGIYSLGDIDSDSCGTESGEAALIVAGATVSENRAGNDGGALYARNTAVEVADSEFSENIAAEDGGAIYRSSGTMTVTATSFLEGEAGEEGGGIFNIGSLDVVDSIFSGNRSDSEGGGIYHTFGNLSLIGSTIADNFAAEEGGGLQLFGDDTNADITNSTVSGNSTDGDGGGIYVGCTQCSAIVEIRNSTIVANSADGLGGGLDIGSGDEARLFNTILAGNLAQQGNADCNNEGGTLTVNNFNLFSGDGSQCGAGANDILLGPLGLTIADVLENTLTDNGGPTPTHALIADSPAIDAGNLAGCVDSSQAPITTDQRGEPRPQEIACDIGAYESDLARPTYEIALSAQPDRLPVGQSSTISATVTNQVGGPEAGVTVEILGSGANDFSGTITTDASGNGSLTHDSGFNPGFDTILGWVDVDGDGSLDAGSEPTATVAIEWLPIAVELEVPSEDQLVGTTQELVATIVVSDTVREPVAGVRVGFQVDGQTQPGIVLTDAQGQASITYSRFTNTITGTATAVESITAWADLNENGSLDTLDPNEPVSPVQPLTWRGMEISFRGSRLGDIPGGVRRQVLATVRQKGNVTATVADVQVGFMVTGGTTVEPEFESTNGNGQVFFFYHSYFPEGNQLSASSIEALLVEAVTTWVDLNGDTTLNAGEPVFTDPDVVTWVQLLSLSVERRGSDVMIRWRTGAEVDNAGFNLYRAPSADGPFVLLNDGLIAGQGTGYGAAYEYLDSPPDGADYVYRLEDVDLDGFGTSYGPVQIGSSLYGGSTFTSRIFLPLAIR